MTYKVNNLKSDMETWIVQVDREIATAVKMLEEGNRTLAHLRGKRATLEGVVKSIERVDAEEVKSFPVANMEDVLRTLLINRNPVCAADIAKIVKIEEGVQISQRRIGEIFSAMMEEDSRVKGVIDNNPHGKDVLYYYLDTNE